MYMCVCLVLVWVVQVDYYRYCRLSSNVLITITYTLVFGGLLRGLDYFRLAIVYHYKCMSLTPEVKYCNIFTSPFLSCFVKMYLKSLKQLSIRQKVGNDYTFNLYLHQINTRNNNSYVVFPRGAKLVEISYTFPYIWRNLS